MKASGFKYLIDRVWKHLKNWMMAFASFCVLLVSLLLVGMSVLFYMNLTSMIGGVEDKNEVIIYMDEGTSGIRTCRFSIGIGTDSKHFGDFFLLQGAGV